MKNILLLLIVINSYSLLAQEKTEYSSIFQKDGEYFITECEVTQNRIPVKSCCGFINHSLAEINRNQTPRIVNELGTCPQFKSLERFNSNSILQYFKERNNFDNTTWESLNSIFQFLGYEGVNDINLTGSKIMETYIPIGFKGNMGNCKQEYEYVEMDINAAAFKIYSVDNSCHIFIAKKCGNVFYNCIEGFRTEREVVCDTIPCSGRKECLDKNIRIELSTASEPNVKKDTFNISLYATYNKRIRSRTKKGKSGVSGKGQRQDQKQYDKKANSFLLFSTKVIVEVKSDCISSGNGEFNLNYSACEEDINEILREEEWFIQLNSKIGIEATYEKNGVYINFSKRNFKRLRRIFTKKKIINPKINYSE